MIADGPVGASKWGIELRAGEIAVVKELVKRCGAWQPKCQAGACAAQVEYDTFGAPVADDDRQTKSLFGESAQLAVELEGSWQCETLLIK